MSLRDVGSYIGHNRVTTTAQGSASGIWSLAAVERRRRAAAWPLAVINDQYFLNVSLLLHFDGSNNSTTFTDSSPANRTATAVGNAKISTAQSKFGGSSLLVDGNGDYVSFPDSDDLDFGAGDFTIEAWVRLAAHPTSYAGAFQAGIVSKDSSSTSGWYLNVGGSGSESLILNLSGSDGSRQEITATANLSLSTWYHVAAVREGNLIYIYRDGTLLNSGGTSYTKTLTNSTTTLKVGAVDYDITYKFWLNGNVDEVRITKGVARYPGGTTFTPPTAAFPDTGPAFTPDSITGLQAWWSASDAVRSGSNVTSWPSRVGGYTLSVGSGQPTYSATGFNDLPQVSFDGVDDAMRTTENVLSLGFSDSMSMFAVVRPASLPGTARPARRYAVIGGETQGQLTNYLSLRSYLGSQTWNAALGRAGVSDSVADSSVSVTVLRKLHGMTYNGATITNFLNNSAAGTQSSSPESSATSGSGSFTLGTLFYNGSYLSDFFSHVDIAEVVIFNKALSDAERTQIYNYFNNLYSFE